MPSISEALTDLTALKERAALGGGLSAVAFATGASLAADGS